MITETRNMSAFAIGAAVLAICSTGCMVSPQHGEYVGHTSGSVICAGATLEPGQAVEVQARHPNGQWVTIHQTTTGHVPYVDENGEWYVWMASQGFLNGLRIPSVFWTPAQDPNAPGPYQAELRAIVPGNDFLEDGMFTYELGWSLGDPSDIHGTTVTIYGR